MRPIGTLPDEAQARRFEDHLLTLEIPSLVEAAGDAWEVWIRDDRHLPRATEEFERFRQDPDDSRYRSSGSAAAALREERRRQEKAARSRQVDLRSQWGAPLTQRCPVTISMIALSVLVAVLSSLGEQPGRVASLFILPMKFGADGSVSWLRNLGLIEVLSAGEVWRPFTPMFIHFGILHLLFNMMWTWSLGTALEARRGSLRYTLIVLAVSGGASVLQYLSDGSPYFGGMSGVVYGLFGYIWVKGKVDPADGLFMPPTTVYWMLAWFFLCMIGVVPHVANVAHGAGLGIGAALAYLSASLRQAGR